MKTLKTLFITAAILCMAGAVYAEKNPGAGGKDNRKQEVRESTGTMLSPYGPKIVFEEEEVTLFDENGKECREEICK